MSKHNEKWKVQERGKADRKKRIRVKIAEFEEFEKSWSEKLQNTSRRIDFREGIILGLILGILGNLFVQFFYPLFEHAILGKFNIVFWSNLVVCAFAIAIVLYKVRGYQRELKGEYRKVGLEIHEAFKARWTITDLKKLLEEETNKS